MAVGMWWGRWDLNPGSHAPQACILIQARRRPLRDTCFFRAKRNRAGNHKNLNISEKRGKSEHLINSALGRALA